MSHACSDGKRNLPDPSPRPPSSQDSESSWTSTVDASPGSLSDSEFSESDDEHVLAGKGRLGTAESSLEPTEAGHQTENVLMVAKTVLAGKRQVKEKRPGRPRKVENAISGEPIKRNLRVKTGCHTCRKRKKKCDEAKPECKCGEGRMDRVAVHPPLRVIRARKADGRQAIIAPEMAMSVEDTLRKNISYREAETENQVNHPPFRRWNPHRPTC